MTITEDIYLHIHIYIYIYIYIHAHIMLKYSLERGVVFPPE